MVLLFNLYLIRAIAKVYSPYLYTTNDKNITNINQDTY